MTALPVFDFARDVASDYARDSAASNTRAKVRPDDVRDRAAPDDVRGDRVSDFDKALRDQDHDEPARPRAERAPDRTPDRVNERPKDIALADSARNEAPAAAEAEPPAESKPAAKPDAAKVKPADAPSEAQAAVKPTLILPDVVQVVSAAPPGPASLKPAMSSEASADSKADGSDAPVSTECLAPPILITTHTVQTAAQNLQAALAVGAPAQQQPQHAAAASGEAAAVPADPLAALNNAQAGLKTDAPAQTAAQPSGQTSNSANAAVPPPSAAFEAAATTNAAPDAKMRPTSEPAAKSSDAPAASAAPASAATAQNAAQPVAALQNALKAAAAQGPKDVNAGDVQVADVKAGAVTQPSAVAAQSTATTTHASAAAQGQASPNTTAIAHNVVRFFRETGSGNARFDIRLDPVELGRVDARVEINQDKTVTLTLSAERPETLAELMRTARDLERQLSDSGVKLSDDGLKFRLNSDARGDAQQNMQSGSDGRRPTRGAYGSGAEPDVQAETAIPIRSWRASGVDVWA